MFAIIETGGKQYQVTEGRYVDVELLGAQKDEKITFDKVVMLANGKKSKVGQPYVANATVEGIVTLIGKDKKVIVYKQRPKKGYRVKRGHRQGFARVMINKIRTKAEKEATAAVETETVAAEAPKAKTTKSSAVKSATTKTTTKASTTKSTTAKKTTKKAE